MKLKYDKRRLIIKGKEGKDYRPFFVINFTRRNVVKMRTKSFRGIKSNFCPYQSNNSRASMVFFRQWFPWWIRIQLLSAISHSM